MLKNKINDAISDYLNSKLVYIKSVVREPVVRHQSRHGDEFVWSTDTTTANTSHIIDIRSSNDNFNGVVASLSILVTDKDVKQQVEYCTNLKNPSDLATLSRSLSFIEGMAKHVEDAANRNRMSFRERVQETILSALHANPMNFDDKPITLSIGEGAKARIITSGGHVDVEIFLKGRSENLPALSLIIDHDSSSITRCEMTMASTYYSSEDLNAFTWAVSSLARVSADLGDMASEFKKG